MKILFPFVGDTIGGSHISTLILVKELKKKGYEATIGLHLIDGPLAKYLESNKIDYICLPSVKFIKNKFTRVRTILLLISLFFPLLIFLKRGRYKIVHTNDWRMHILWIFPVKLSFAAFVWHQRSITNWKISSFLGRFADKIITISEFCKNSFHPRIHNKVHVIYNPFETFMVNEVNKVEGRRRLQQDLKLNDSTKLIGFVGNCTLQKRPQTYIRIAYEAVIKRKMDAVFVLIGDLRDEEGKKLFDMIEEFGLTDHCILYGSHFPIEPFMCGFDIFVATAINEGFGRTVVEAMLCKTPVIISDHGGHSEIITHGENGFLVCPDDIGNFVDYIELLFSDKKIHNDITEKAYQEARRKYTVQKHTHEIIGIYESCL